MYYAIVLQAQMHTKILHRNRPSNTLQNEEIQISITRSHKFQYFRERSYLSDPKSLTILTFGPGDKDH